MITYRPGARARALVAQLLPSAQESLILTAVGMGLL